LKEAKEMAKSEEALHVRVSANDKTKVQSLFKSIAEGILKLDEYEDEHSAE
jgi:hypothetical protein